MACVQRGAIVAQNKHGTLERVDGTSTYIGSCDLLTKRFRSAARDDREVIPRWRRWQSRKRV